MRHAVITAGSKGIGRKVTEEFLRKGCSVTVNYNRDKDKINELIKEWEPYKERLQFVQGDVTRKDDIANIVEMTMSRFGRIDYLINNAGPYIFERKKLMDYEDNEWYEMIDGNLNAVYHFLKLTIPVMRKQRFGRIITYGFQDAEHSPGWKYRSAFSAAKVGLVSLTRTIALEEAEYGITANMVCPGDIVGEMKEADIETARQIKDERTPIGRSGTGEDIARLIGFICDKDSDLITGSIISASGGIHVVNRYKN
ncbi:MAG TPA: SDR family NAD(P)-dependent oxidoreductase [Bacillus bacterium]|uniref:Oxidoreductase YtkK n=1 Tax=Siminovitchia fordii TaxID=254759 RepID=A0ABQ4K8J3_9BACI|nr:SDR family oxidoreductase [Siminovitchia fordii]GIN21495.1 putative oxidoreductase YtkK [Siminovitchia fordii]HBZ08870.1 SDR family NAD(P)-dependent oxidoreductase [Bacillus sp. (in: firmicutes)]